MTTTAEPALSVPSARRQPVALCVLVAVTVVVGWVSYRHWLMSRLESRILRWDVIIERWWLVNLVTALLLCVPYALVLLVWGRTSGRRAAGALVAVGAGVYLWVVYEVFSHYVWNDGPAGQASSEAYARVTLLGVAVLVPLAWGVARRHGRAWLAGLLVSPAVAAGLYQLQLDSPWWRRHVTRDAHSYHWTIQALVYVGPFVLGALACWWVEAVTSRRTPGTVS
jgi:hypothetical protein